MNKKILFIILGLFLITRLFGLDQLYHQDEYRWASIANPAFGELSAPHPPINKWALSLIGTIWGYNNLRLVPLIFSLLNLFLIYFVSLKISGSGKTAIIAAGLFTINVYSAIASLQVDIDGAILPFFVLLSYYLYLKFLDGDKRSGIFLILAIAGGFLAKVSFFIFIGALILDSILRVGKIRLSKKNVWYGISGAVALAAFYLLYASRLPLVIEYAKHFTSLNFGSRAYFDLIFKLFKSLIWLSPLLAVPVVYGLFKGSFTRYRFWYLYLFLNLVFYLILFDFTRLTIERYFMFLVVPTVLISADVISRLMSLQARPVKQALPVIVGIAGFVLLLIVVSLINQVVVPLNPKAEYASKVKSLDFNFLIPLTGGSGPIGFYTSAQFVFWAWVVSLAAFAASLNKPKLFYVFIIFGLGYNALLANEYLFGSQHGSVNDVTEKAISYALDDANIKEVITYYDAGAYYLRLGDKYHSRFYTAPSRDYTKKLTEYRGHYMIVDFPAIDKNSEYWKLISRCQTVEKITDKKVDVYIFDCTKLDKSL